MFQDQLKLWELWNYLLQPPATPQPKTLIPTNDSPRASTPQKCEFPLQCFLMSRSTFFFPFCPLLHLYCCLSFYCFFSIMQVPSHICDFSALWDDFHIFEGTYWTLVQTRSKKLQKMYKACKLLYFIESSLYSLILCMNVFMSQVRYIGYTWICLFLSIFFFYLFKFFCRQHE